MKELELNKQKLGDQIVRARDGAARESDLQVELRKAGERMTAQRELQADRDYLEREFAKIKGRLEEYDPRYKRENQLLLKVVRHLERRRVSVIQAFEQFDEDHDGQLSRAEFTEALA